MLHGIDISGHQHDAISPLIPFVFLRATQEEWEDVTFNGTGTWNGERYFLLRKALLSGAVVGAYHYLIARGSPELQAAHFVNAIRRANNNLDGILCAVVVEHSEMYRSMPNADHVHRFITEFQRLVPNHPLFVYTNTLYWQSHVKMDLRIYKNVYLWLAWWTDTSGDIMSMRPMLPTDAWTRRIGGLQPTIIQFTSQARSNGVRVRGNLFNGTRQQLQQLTMPPPPSIPIATSAFKDRFQSYPVTKRIAPDPKTKTKLLTGSVVVGSIAIVVAVALIALKLGQEKWSGIFEEYDE